MIKGIVTNTAGCALATLKKNATPVACAVATPLTVSCCAATKQELDKFSVDSNNHLKLAGLFFGSILGGTLTFMLFMHLICTKRSPQKAEDMV